MTEDVMPATEAAVRDADERTHYELAFHILPTVAEEEVPAVFGEIKTQIDRVGGEVTSEEAPQRLDLAYEVVQSIEGRNRRYDRAYFGWVRFKLSAGKLEELTAELAHNASLLRTLVTTLTKRAVAEPFRIFELRKAEPPEEGGAVRAKKEVSEADIEGALEEITSEPADEKKE